ncbi:Uncharacterised protein [uncultured archaeon]|nr:Uncharacterised protein [uncultured archaeon]
MVSWDIEKLTWDIGESTIKRFHLGTERDLRNRFQLKNIARVSSKELDTDYFDYNFKIRLEENDEKHLIIEIFSPQKGLEDIARYIKREVDTGFVFSNGFLKSVGERSEFKKYSERLEYIGMQDTETEYAPDRFIPVLRVSYKITGSLLKLNTASFIDTVQNYAILPFFAFALNTREP